MNRFKRPIRARRKVPQIVGGGHWNGEPCQAEKGTVICGKAMRPTWWCASLAGQRLKCVKVTQDGQSVFLNDEDGSGSHKVFETQGGPRCANHANIPVDDAGTFIPSNTPAVGEERKL